jgi:predicted phosphodiesterase
MTAMKIKKELQKLSPSRRCSWNSLVRMMELEGFYDSENSENYRCLIKAYQKSVGELPEAPKHADMVASSKLKSIKEIVGEMRYEKHENQRYLREVNKGVKELINFSTVVEEIVSAIKSHDFSELQLEYKPIIKTTDKTMIVALSDMHIGAIVDTDINTYNYQVTIRRLEEYANRVLRECKEQEITDVYVMNLGDVVEHASMRFSQGYNAEFTYSDQIVKASDAIIKFLQLLAQEGLSLTYAGIAGNHDRVNDKDKNIDGDHAVKPINKIIETFIKYSGMPITYEQAKDYKHSIGVNGRSFKFVHGDLDSLRNEKLLAQHSSDDRVAYDAIVMGHYHHFREIEVGYDKRIIVFGSLKGADEYAEKIRKLSQASQGIIIVDEDGQMEVKRIPLT